MDTQARRQKQQALMAELLERKIRLHARQRYEQRGQVEGFALQDWVEAESEVLSKTVFAPSYRKDRQAATEGTRDSSACEVLA